MVTARKPDSDGDFHYEMIPAGTHMARCFAVVDLGMHKQDYQGDVSIKHKVRVSFETPLELLTEEGEFKGQPFSISVEYTLSLSEKANLRKDLESWRGRPFTDEELDGFELDALLGKPCMISVVHKQSQAGRTYAKLASIAGMPKGMEIPGQVNKTMLFDLDAPNWQGEFNQLPEWLQKKINTNKNEPTEEYANQVPDKPMEEDFDDDIPF